jgi:hypothetical protein
LQYASGLCYFNVGVSTDPKAPLEILTATTEAAAQSQLETAIMLWFQYGDPVSIHTLAAAASGCYHALGDKKGTPTVIETFIKSLPKKKRPLARAARNFFKHGPERGREKIVFRPEEAELLMLDSIISHEQLFPTRTPLMTCFFARLSYENPRLLEHLSTMRCQQGLKQLEVYEGAEPDRMKFLSEVLPTLRKLRK